MTSLNKILGSTGMGDARKEIKPNLVGDVWPVAVKMTLLRMCVETT